MKIPKTLKIGGHVYKVVLQGSSKLDNVNIGCTSRKENEIVLDISLPQDQIEATFFHEVLHTLNNELAHPIIDSLAEQLYQVFLDNHLLK